MYQMIVLPPFFPSPLPLLSSLSLLSSHPRRSGANTSSLALARLLTVMDYLMFQFSGESTQHFEQLTEQVCGVAAAVYVPLQWVCLVPLQWACLVAVQCGRCVQSQWCECMCEGEDRSHCAGLTHSHWTELQGCTAADTCLTYRVIAPTVTIFPLPSHSPPSPPHPTQGLPKPAVLSQPPPV